MSNTDAARVGKACEPLGGCVGARFLEWQHRAETAEAELERLTATLAKVDAAIDGHEAEVADARQRLAAVAALADEWSRLRCGVRSPGLRMAVADLGKAIKDDNDKVDRQDYQKWLNAPGTEVERLTRECLDREATETDAREQLRRYQAARPALGAFSDWASPEDEVYDIWEGNEGSCCEG